MKILVCGGRDYDSEIALSKVLDRLNDSENITELIHGGARGADTLAGQWARDRDIPVTVFHADWKRHGKAAGVIRNQEMLVDGDPDIVLAFPGGRGTEHMVKVAKAWHKNIEVIKLG